jgi:hypothetical protein
LTGKRGVQHVADIRLADKILNQPVLQIVNIVFGLPMLFNCSSAIRLARRYDL